MSRDLSRHQCPVSICRKLLPPAKLMCLDHWRKVPIRLQRAVTSAYADGEGTGTPELADAQQAAIAAVEAKVLAKAGAGC